MTPNREHDGRFTSQPVAPPVSLVEAIEIYNRYLAVICSYQGLSLPDVHRQLSRTIHEASRAGGEATMRGGPSIRPDREWLQAVYARQLAVYLANTVHNVKQKMLAQITGVTPAAIFLALRSVEDLRDHKAYDLMIEKITIEAKATNAAGAKWA